MSDNDNIVPFGAIKGGKGDGPDETVDDGIPINDYIITDIDNQEFAATGFLIFTSHHLAIMRDNGKGAIPIMVFPIDRVKVAELYEDFTDA